MRLLHPILLSTSAVAVLAVHAQDAPSSTTPDGEAWEVAFEAYRELGTSGRAFHGTVSHDEEGLADQRIWFGSENQVPAPPFLGAFEGHRWDAEEFVVRSLDELPGFQAWVGEQPVIEMMVTNEVVDVHGMVERITPLIDPTALAKAADEGEWTAERPAIGEGWILKSTLPGSFANPPSLKTTDEWGNGNPVSTVIRVECALTVDTDGRAVGATYEVVWNDVNAVLNRLMEENDGVFHWQNIDSEEPVDGAVTTWTIEYDGPEPCEAVAAYRGRVLDLVGRVGFPTPKPEDAAQILKR